jgi:ribose transport system substrate-binding protein
MKSFELGDEWKARRAAAKGLLSSRRWSWCAILLAAVSLALLAGCGSDDGGETTADSGDGGATNAALTNPGTEAKPLSRPFDPDVPAGEVPDLPRRIGYSMPANAEFFQRLNDGIDQAAEEHDLEVLVANADGDAATQVSQLESFLQRGVAAIALVPTDVEALQDVLTRALDEGVAVYTLVTPPTTNFGNTDQYDNGYVAALDAVKFINEELGGEAEVMIFNEDSYPPLVPRHEGWLDGLKTGGPGVKVVVDVQPDELTTDASAEAMRTALQAHPGINVVLGNDIRAVGALSALEAAGKDPETTYLGGIDGESVALAEIKKPNSIYKSTYGVPVGMQGYSYGVWTAEWLEGKSIPQASMLNAIRLDSAESIEAFEAVDTDPAATWNDDPSEFLTYFGNISYETRAEHIDYFWAPPGKSRG